MSKQPCTYILASAKNGTLYIGVTSNLVQRIWQHKNNEIKGLHQIEWVSANDEPLLDRDPALQNGSRWLGCTALYCESRDSGL